MDEVVGLLRIIHNEQNNFAVTEDRINGMVEDILSTIGNIRNIQGMNMKK